MSDAASEGREKTSLKGRLVEGVRLLFITLLATAGYEIGATGATPFIAASGRSLNTGLLSKNTSSFSLIPYASGLLLSTRTWRIEPGT